MPGFLRSAPIVAITLVLLVQGGLLYSSIRPEAVPASTPLSEVPKTLGAWSLAQEGVMEPEIQAALQADDLLNRTYVDVQGRRQADLYVAAYRSQKTGKAPHSPKNCLPGAGWLPLVTEEVSIDPGNGVPITVNRDIITRGDNRSLVLYWYQSRDRVVAGEYKAKFWVIADAIRLNRTDTALVRVIIPIAGDGTEQATQTAIDFVRAFYAPLRSHLPA